VTFFTVKLKLVFFLVARRGNPVVALSSGFDSSAARVLTALSGDWFNDRECVSCGISLGKGDFEKEVT